LYEEREVPIDEWSIYRTLANELHAPDIIREKANKLEDAHRSHFGLAPRVKTFASMTSREQKVLRD
jgi:hypothetical protein